MGCLFDANDHKRLPVYSPYFCKYISSNMRHISLDIFSTFFNNFADFAASIYPVTISVIATKKVTEFHLKATDMIVLKYIEALMRILLCQVHKLILNVTSFNSSNIVLF